MRKLTHSSLYLDSSYFDCISEILAGPMSWGLFGIFCVYFLKASASCMLLTFLTVKSVEQYKNLAKDLMSYCIESQCVYQYHNRSVKLLPPPK